MPTYTIKHARRIHTVAIVTRRTGKPGKVRVQDVTGPVRLVFEVDEAKLTPVSKAAAAE